MPKKIYIAQGLALVFDGIRKLRANFDHRKFTIDGRLVGDIGEVLAEIEYELKLDAKSRKTHDAKTPDGKDVQIKATFQDSLTFSSTPELYLGFKLSEDGTYEEIFNGPGQLIFERFEHRKGIGEKLLSFPLAELRELAKQVPEASKIQRRKVQRAA
jgi:hypothetical protein